MLALLTTVPALAPAQSGDEAKKLFEAMEERIAKAKSVSLTFRIDAKLGGEHIKLTGSMAFAAGNKASIYFDGEVDGKPFKGRVVSDGKKIRFLEAAKTEEKTEDKPAPKQQNEILSATLSRVGLSLGLEWVEKIDRLGGRKAEEWFPVSDLKLSRNEKVAGREAQVLTYTVRYDAKRKMNARLWIDTQTGLPLKRELLSSAGVSKEQITEIYNDLKLNEKRDPKQFELPK
jgi:outer membrane lipoprotein-sorting protein